MNTENVTSEDKIILAAIDLIEEKGMQSLTIRNIAKKAGVNSAAINYYFRSKENLLNEVLKTTADHAISDWKEIINKKSVPPKKRLEEFLIYMMDGGIKFSGITLAHLYDPLINKNYDNHFVVKFNKLMKSLQKLIELVNQDKSEKEINLIVIQIISAAIMPVLVSEMYRDFAGISFSDSKTRREYIEQILRCHINSGSPADGESPLKQ